MALAQLRFLAAGAALFGLLAVTRQLARPGSLRALALLGLVGVTINQGLFLAGLRRSISSHGALLYAATPIVVLSIALLRGQERASPRRVLGVALAFSGVAYL